jgi:hypothetical protein
VELCNDYEAGGSRAGTGGHACDVVCRLVSPSPWSHSDLGGEWRRQLERFLVSWINDDHRAPEQ